MTKSRPVVTATTHTLPVERLSPGDFERLCLALLPREGFASPQHYGASGGESGRDIVTCRGAEVWYVQCKRVRQCGPKVLLDEIEKIRRLIESDPDLRPTGILFIASCDVSATARDRPMRRCAELDLACEVWGRTDLDARLQPHHDIITKFFRPTALMIGVPFQAPAVSRYFVPRPEETRPLLDYLLADAPTETLVVSAVHGLGGIGKTTLVAALAHSREVQHHFPDGILWATLGQQAEVISRLQEWIQSLGDYQARPTTVDGASAHLRTLLHDKACLLVVDDAWQAEQVRPFLVGGERCRVVVTTRDAGLARKVGASLFDVDVMTEAQALALFENRLGALSPSGNREQAATLARQLGYLPLALELAAAQIEGGCAWAELLTAFEQGLADLSALDLDEAEHRNESLRLSFRLSLDRLTGADRLAFAWLGVLPEDAILNPAMAATLWDQSEADAGRRLRRLRDQALLMGVDVDRYTVHDLLHDEARLRLAEWIALSGAHAALLKRYRSKTQGDLWHTLPDDSYIHEHLAWHMEQAGKEEMLHALLAEETAAGRNGWFEARERLGQTAGYVTDVMLAWRLTEERCAAVQTGSAEEPHRHQGWGLQCRYALIRTSLNSLAAHVPATLLVALVDQGVWTPAQAMTYARQVPEPERQVAALAALAPQLTRTLREEALVEGLAATRTVWDEKSRAEALVTLAPQLTGAQREEALGEGLAVARAIWDEKSRAEAMVALAPQLTGAQREEALIEGLAAARAIVDGEARARLLAALAPQLTGGRREEALIEGLTTARAIRGKWYRARLLAVLAPQLTGVQREEALVEGLTTARAIGDKWARAQTLAALTLQLTGTQREEVLVEGLAAARAIEHDGARALALAALAPQLTGAQREEVLVEGLAAARIIEDDRTRAEAMTALAPQLKGAQREEMLTEGLAAARAIGPEWARAQALAALAPQLMGELLIEGLVSARAIGDEEERAHALAALALQLTGAQREEALVEGLSAARAIKWQGARAHALAALAPQLTGVQREEALVEGLAAARAIEWQGARAEALAALVPQLTRAQQEEVLVEGLSAARAIWGEGMRAQALASLAPQLIGKALVEGLAMVRVIRHEWSRAQALAALAPQLTGEWLAQGLAVARAIQHDESRAHALAALAPQLTGAQREEVLVEGLAAARTIEHYEARAEALAALAPQLTGELLAEGVAVARAIGWEWARAAALVALAPQLTGELREEALIEGLTAARAAEWQGARAEALAALAPQLKGDLLVEGLAVASTISDRAWHADALMALARQLTKAQQEEVLVTELAVASSIGDKRECAAALAALAPQLTDLPFMILYPLWQETLHHLADRTRQDLLSDLGALAPALVVLGGEQAVAETFRAIQDVGRWWP